MTPGSVIRSLIEIDLLHTKTQLLVDTGAKLSCISEQLLQCDGLFKSVNIRKCDKRAYGVNGEPVVTLGIVDLEFKIDGVSFTHSFTILRGLIHPMLLGMDFLIKHKACIDLGTRPSIKLHHPRGKIATALFLKAMPKPKPATHVALMKEITIPPRSFYYADAYVANFECADVEPENQGKIIGITAVQKANEFFDPGFLLRDAVIPSDAQTFKVELANPSLFPLKVAEDTPLGVVFDYNCEVMETDDDANVIWEDEPADDAEGFLRQQALLTANINLLEEKATPTAECPEPIVTEATLPKPQPWLPGSVKKKDCAFTMAYSEETEQKLQYSDIHGKGKSQKERMYMVDMDDASYTPEQRKELEQILENNIQAFSLNDRDTGCTDIICHHVKITNPRPVYLSYNKAQGADIRKEIDDQTNGMLADGIVVESESPYCCPIVMVRKKYGGWRYCVDLRRINQMTEKVTFPMPRIEDALRKLKKPKYFSSMDLLKAYYQIPVAEEDQRYYAFSDGRRHLQFTRCPMGAKNSGSTLAMLMELVLRGLPPECVIGYLDDILLATEDWDTHMVLLDKLLKSIIKAKLKLCPIKCQFARLETKTLGHVLSQEGIRPDKYNLDKVKEWSEAKNVAEVRTFLGLTGYYRSLIKNYAHIASPLSDLLHTGKEWQWGPKEKEAFHRLKQILVSEPIAAYPDYDKEFQLKTDASKVALGGILGQIQEGKERMIACMSKKFTKDELKWAPYDREFLAMILPTRHFSHYLRWKPFKLYTDHKPLLAWKDVTTQKDGSGKRTRWVMELSTYDVEVIHKEGKKHGDADALSRHPHPDEPDPEEDEDSILSTVTDAVDQATAGDEDFRHLLRKEKSRIPHMVRELSKFNVQVVYTERGVNKNSETTHVKNLEVSPNDNVICSLSTQGEMEINLLAAQSFMEVALVEIHADEGVEKEMAEAQRQDGNISKALQMVNGGVTDIVQWRQLPQWFQQNRSDFVTNRGILYHVKSINSHPDPVARVVIPKAKIKEMLFRCHGCMQSGHPGHLRAIARVERFATWPGMVADIKDHVKRCAECQAARDGVPKRMAPVQPQKAMAPLQFIQADLFKTGTEANGMKYVCVFEDRFTKLCKMYALKDAKARSVAKCIESLVSELGCPDTWGTDGGPEFYNTLTMAICHVFRIKKEFALAYRPQSQGQTERKNRTLKAELTKRISQFGKSWPSYLKWIEMAYNCTPHPSHGHTPFLLMYGREAKLPIEADLPKFDTKGWQPSLKSYLADFLDRMAVLRKQVIVNRTMYQLKMAQKHDDKLLEPLKPGEKVLRDVPGQFRTKLDLKRDGPWVVEEQRVKDGKVLPVYKLKNEAQQITLAHRESLVPFFEPNFNDTTSPEEEAEPVVKKKVPSCKTVISDGPATRTRSRLSIISRLPRERRPVNGPAALVDVNDPGDDGGDAPDDEDAHNDDPGDDSDGDGGDSDGDGTNDDPGDESDGDTPGDTPGDDSEEYSDGAIPGDVPGDDSDDGHDGDVPGDDSGDSHGGDVPGDEDPNEDPHNNPNDLGEDDPDDTDGGNGGGAGLLDLNAASPASAGNAAVDSPENTASDGASSAYATPDSLETTAIEVQALNSLQREGPQQTSSVNSLPEARPSLTSLPSYSAMDNTYSDVFDETNSIDMRRLAERKIPFDHGSVVESYTKPWEISSHVIETVETRSGDPVEVRRSTRHKTT